MVGTGRLGLVALAVVAFAGCTSPDGLATAQSLAAHADALAAGWDGDALLVAVGAVTGPDGRANSWDFYYVGHGTWLAVHVRADGGGSIQELGPSPPPSSSLGIHEGVSWVLDSDAAVRLALASDATFAQLAETGLEVSLVGRGSWCIVPAEGAGFVGAAHVDADGNVLRKDGERCRIDPLVWGRSECGPIQASLDATQPTSTQTWKIEDSGHAELTVFLHSQTSTLGGGDVDYVLERDGAVLLEGTIAEGEEIAPMVADPAPGEYYLTFEFGLGAVRQSIEGSWKTDVAPAGAFDSTLIQQGGCAW